MHWPLSFLGYVLVTGWTVVTISGLKIQSPEAVNPGLKHSLHASHLPRSKRATGCPAGKVITKEKTGDSLLPVSYTSKELDACLDDQVLSENLANLTGLAFTDEQMEVLKTRLNKMYPKGYPKEVIMNLGILLDIMNEEDIKPWNISSTELEALLKQQPVEPVATWIIRRFTDSGNPLDAGALDAIGRTYICLLDEKQLRTISEEAIRTAKPLEVSDCPQATVDILYPQAKRAFSNIHNSPEYYGKIKNLINGAPLEDLKALSKNTVNMDIETLMSLPKEKLMGLKPIHVKGLLGSNAENLKKFQNVPPIYEWIVKQKQADLGAFLGLTGGLPEGYMNVPRRPKNP